MGQIFSNLTTPGSALQSPSGQTLAIGSPQDIQKQQFNAFQSALRPDVANPTDVPNINLTNLPQVGRPSLQQAATAGALPGSVNPLSPGLNKAGKLFAILHNGLEGALAGHAAQEQAILESGGRRAGGAGLAFQSAYMLPWQRAMAPLQYQQQQAQTALAQAGAQPVQTPYGPMAAELASRSVLPWLVRGQSMENVANIGAGAKTQAAQISGEYGLQRELIGQRFKTVPGMGLYDTQANGGHGGIVPGTAQGIIVTPEIAQAYGIPGDFIGKPMSLQNLSSLERAEVFQNSPMMTEQGPVVINRQTAQATPVRGPGGATYGPTALASPYQVGDPNNPGQTLVVPAGQSFGRPGVQSASVQVPKRAAEAEVPTKIGDTRLAFNTAMQHADLLRQAVTALANGNQQTLSALKNRFKTEFGVSGPVTAQLIADAYSREVQKGLSSGHITEGDTNKVAQTLDVNRQSLQQSLDAINAYKALFQSKLNMLNQQKNAAIQGSQPNAGAPPAGARIRDYTQLQP